MLIEEGTWRHLNYVIYYYIVVAVIDHFAILLGEGEGEDEDEGGISLSIFLSFFLSFFLSVFLPRLSIGIHSSDHAFFCA